MLRVDEESTESTKKRGQELVVSVWWTRTSSCVALTLFLEIIIIDHSFERITRDEHNIYHPIPPNRIS